MNTITKQTLGILGAAALGTAIGILFAPQKGKSTREKIKSQAIGAKDKLKNFSDEAKKKLNTVSEKFQNKKNETISEIHTELDALR